MQDDDDVDIEWLDAGSPPLRPPRPPRPPRGPSGRRRSGYRAAGHRWSGYQVARRRWSDQPVGRRWLYLLAVLVLLALAVVALRPGGATPRASTPDRSHSSSPGGSPGSGLAVAPAPTPSSGPVSSNGPPMSAVPASTATGMAPGVVQRGRPLLDVPAGWELFGLSPLQVVRMQLATGTVTTTSVPIFNSEGPVSFVVGTSEVIIRPLDQIEGFVVPDSQPAGELPSALQDGGPALPGPDAQHVWVPSDTSSDGTVTTMALVGYDGRPTGSTISIPPDAGTLSADGAGYLMFTATGGVYDARPEGLSRITAGTLLATGVTGWLAEECDAQHRCAMTTIARSGQARRTVPTPSAAPADAYAPGGLISPNGASAALLRTSATGTDTLHLLDLGSGRERPISQPIEQTQGYAGATFVWSPDSRWLFASDASGQVFAIDAATGQATNLDVPLLPGSQLGFRNGP